MAITAIGTVTVDFTLPKLYLFPSVTTAKTNGYMFILETVPLNQSITYGHVIVIPTIPLTGVTYERPAKCSWYPKGLPLLFKVSTFEKFPAFSALQIGLWPIQLYKGRTKPKTLQFKLSWDSAITENSAIAD
jgi:hypothetical protein